MDDCIFCKILNGEIPAKKIYEDEKIYAFLDISPQGKGHTLVVPKKHSSDIFEVEEELLCEVLKVVKKLAIHIKEKLNPEGISIVQNNGEIAGQTVFHFHMHIIPRYIEKEEYDIDEVYRILKLN